MSLVVLTAIGVGGATVLGAVLGFMFKNNINYGLIFKNCNGIHTFFMMEEIDVILTDKSNNILYLYPNFKKWRVLLPKKNVYNTYELPRGTIKNLKINDKIKIQE